MGTTHPKMFSLLRLFGARRLTSLQDEGDGSCDSYALGRVCDGEAVDHEPYGSQYNDSKLMDYKAGHDAGYAGHALGYYHDRQGRINGAVFANSLILLSSVWRKYIALLRAGRTYMWECRQFL